MEQPLLDAERGARGIVVDLDTGRVVPRVIRFENDAKTTLQPDGNLLVEGVMQAVWCDNLGKPVFDDGRARVYRARGRFKFIVARNADQAPTVLLGSPNCTKCGSPLTLAGDDLCPRCKATDRGQRNRFSVKELQSPLLDMPCEFKGCREWAEVMVSDEVIVSPSEVHRRLDPHRTHSRRKSLYYERGMTVARHHYCRRHYQPPRILDAKGEVVQVLEPV
jgi:hypothetical protein